MSEESVTSTFADTVTETITSSATATATATAGTDSGEFVPPITVSISMKTPLLSLQKLTSSSLFKSAYEVDESQITEYSLIAPTPTTDSTPALLYNDLKMLDGHEKLLKCSLVERAAESMRRIIKLKETEASVMLLYTRGLIGDESFKRFKLQAKLQDAEMMEVAKEAEGYKQGWSRIIFANAQEVMMNQALRRRVGAISTRKEVTENIEVKGVETVVKDIQQRIIKLK
ncbi:hypothetical protein PMKS-002267 [Pichia membranifaciens]|uniref:Uncharacterized protein n=1 Tax=Pichia membranifaciens TaxID=4926 RepID=A0A1Q2YH30_9ASCO|nr:hypothetical protein PMKS-002267 [Pichia membranifaciens]